MKQVISTFLVIMVIVVVIVVIMNLTGSNSYYQQKNSGTYRCIKVYTVVVGENQTSKRVDLMPSNGKVAVTFTCDDDMWSGVHNSATMYAQFEPNKWYQVSTVGYRRESSFVPQFPNVTFVQSTTEPVPLK